MSVAPDLLKGYIDRIERLTEEKDTFSSDIREVYAEAKGEGFDTKILRKVIKVRKQDARERREEAEILDLYMQALGMTV